MKSLRQLSTLALLGALASGAAWAADAARPLSIAGGFENWRLPGDERLGMAYAEVLFEVAPEWWLGPTVYGAASGQRGGFFVGGLAMQRPLAITPGLSLVPGLAIGGGGGGGAPVGDGLMVRPSLSLQVPFGPWRVGLGVSEVVFPGTSIRSSQIGVVAEWHGQFAAEPLAEVGRRLTANGRSGLGFDRIALTAGRYPLQGNAPSPQVDLVGVRLDRFGTSNAALWGVEVAAAVNGSSAGYMEILVHAGAEIAFADSLRVGARAALGLGGGGAMPTVGGTIGRLDATLLYTPTPGWHLGAEIGRMASTSSAMRGARAELSLATDLEPEGMPGTQGRTGTVKRVEWAGALQQVQSVHRKDGTTESLQTMGLQLNWWLGANAYVTGQAHSAFGGGAGAYSQGLLGAGIATAAPDAWGQVGAELLAGGAGGGGVQSLSGAIAQAMLWLSWMPWRDGSHARLAVGAETSHGGSFSPVVALSWVVPFGLIVR
jgi:hypothetical protein